MKTTTPISKEQAKPRFEAVGECLLRATATGTYYALVKRGGKQFRRSMKTNDRQLAKRRLSEFRLKVNRLTDQSGTSQIKFGELAKSWFGIIRAKLKPSSARRRESSLNNLALTFGDIPVRNITVQLCEKWMQKRHLGICASTSTTTSKLFARYSLSRSATG